MEGPRVEPDLATDESLLGVLAELQQREPIFHHHEHLSGREDFERQTAADFWRSAPPRGATAASWCGRC